MNNPIILLLATIFTTMAGVGATIIVTKSYVFEWLQHAFDPTHTHWTGGNKHLNQLFNCPLCYGFWQGLFFQFLIMLFIGINLNWLYLLPMFFQGCITSVFSILAYLILVKLGLKTVK